MILALPLVIVWLGAIVLALVDGRRKWVGWVAVACLTAAFIATLRLAVAVIERGAIEMVAGGWPKEIGITLRADALGVVFAVAASGVLLAGLIYEVVGGIVQRLLPAVILFMAVGLTGLFLTGDAFNFYVFFEVAMAAGFVLTGYGQDPRHIRGALIFLVVNTLGSVMFLVGIVTLYHVTGTLDMGMIAARTGRVIPNSGIVIAVVIFAAFSIKLGLFPFHFWLPEVYSGARPAVAAILSGALANIGSYGLLRFGGELMVNQLELGRNVLYVFGASSILYGSMVALRRRTVGEVLAYSSIGQAGYILLAISIGGAAGYAAAVIYAIANGLNKTLLFLTIELRGRLTGPAFAIGAMSVAGLPPILGFFGKAALFRAGIASNSVMLVALIFIGGALSFIYMFQLYQRRYWGLQQKTTEASPLAERVLALLLALLLVMLGLWPEPLLAASRHAASVLERRLP